MTTLYYTLLTPQGIEAEAENRAREQMGEVVCRDCGHVCAEETMVKFCDGWKTAVAEAREEVKSLIVQERAAINVGAPGPKEENRE